MCTCVCVSTKQICGPLCMMMCRMVTNGMHADNSDAEIMHFKLVLSGYIIYNFP